MLFEPGGEANRKKELGFLAAAVVVSVAAWACLEFVHEPIVLSRWIMLFGAPLPGWLPLCLAVAGAGAYACKWRLAGVSIATVALILAAGALLAAALRFFLV